MKETDPDLLSEGSKVLDVERVRQVYYSILQDQYSKGCYTKLKKINSAIYPRTPQTLNDIVIKRQLEHPTDMDLDRILFLQEYLGVMEKINVNEEHAQKKARELVQAIKLDPEARKNMRKPAKKPKEIEAKRATASQVMDSFPRLRAKSVTYSTLPLSAKEIGVAKTVLDEGVPR